MKRFIEIIHNMTWDSNGNVQDIQEQRELIPIDNIRKAYLHMYEEGSITRYAVAVEFFDPSNGRAKTSLERGSAPAIQLRWKHLRRQLDHLLEDDL